MTTDRIGFTDTMAFCNYGIVSHGNVGGVKQSQGFRLSAGDGTVLHLDIVMKFVDVLLVFFIMSLTSL